MSTNSPAEHFWPGNTADGLPDWARQVLAFVQHTPDADQIAKHVRALGEAAKRGTAEYAGPEARSAGHRLYDSLIEDMFTAVIRAVPREELLSDVLKRLTGAEIESRAIEVFVIESQLPRNRVDNPRYRVIRYTKLPSGLWDEFNNKFLLNMSGSRFLRDVVHNGVVAELWLSSFISNYDGEFDTLVRASREDFQRGYWISTAALPSGRSDRPNHAVVALYPNPGTDTEPRTPRGANQELRVLHFLTLAYGVLDRQLAGVADEVIGQRKRVLADIAPGILHHEIGAQIGVMRPILDVQQRIAQRLSDGLPKNNDIQNLTEGCDALLEATTRLNLITSAFNNLERRLPREAITLAQLAEQVAALMHYRLGFAGVILQWSPEDLAINILTDPALLMHAILNVTINAVNAFIDWKDSPKERNTRVIGLRGSLAERDTLAVVLDIYNNGPPIAEELFDRIFEKGFTTRRDGHGQGLFIARLIAQALGGQLSLLPEAAMPNGWTVGFRLQLPREIERRRDMESERHRHR